MTTKYTIICLIVVFSFASFAQLSTGAEVESQLECTSTWQKLQLNWNFVVTNSSAIENFSLFWRTHEQEFKNQTVRRLLLAVNYPKNFTNTFSCYGNVTGPLRNWSNDVSFIVQLPKVWNGTELIGFRYVKANGLIQRLEFYIKPKANINDISYSVSYCWQSKHDRAYAINYTCRRLRTVKFQCSQRQSNVYGLQNTVGLICRATTLDSDYINFYAKIKFFIQTTTRFTSVSSNFRLEALQSTNGPISWYPEQGKFTVVLMGQKSAYLTMTTTEQKVVLQWEDTSAYIYRINYWCSNGLNSSLAVKTARKTIPDPKFAPYTLCHFCVTNQISEGSLYSEPLCNSTRFPERLPSKPPTITCHAATCPSTTYNKTRAVTIKCKFPPENTRNGLLNKLVINYWNDSSNSTDPEKSFTTNLTSCKITLTGLSKRHSYFAQMSVCNSKGCSAFSDTGLIAQAINTNTNTGSQSGPVTFKWWLIVIIIFALIVCIIGLIFLVYRRLTKHRQIEALPNIQDPDDYEHLEPDMAHQLNQYHDLSEGDDNQNNGKVDNWNSD